MVVLDPFVATLPLTARGILSILNAVDATVLLGGSCQWVPTSDDPTIPGDIGLNSGYTGFPDYMNR